jgi:coenzyme F420-dependent oxidoreductase
MLPLGLSLTPSKQIPPRDLVRLARAAEDAGYDSVWLPETWGYDSVSLLATLADRTSRIRIAAGVLNVYSRSAGLIAQTSATLQDLSSGRFILGLGTSGPRVIEGWHGTDYREPLARTRDYVEIIRLALSGERVDYRGRAVATSGFRLSVRPQSVPIYLAALGPRNTRLAGELADGWLPIFAPRGHFTPLLDDLRKGARDMGREEREIDVAAYLPGCTGARAERLLRQQIAYYVGGMGTYYADYLRRLGFGQLVSAVRQPWQAGDRAAAVQAVDEALLDLCTLGADARTAAERLEMYRREGVSLPIITVPAGCTPDEAEASIRGFAP